MHKKVAIIGAGPSGLALAKQLVDRNIEFVIYERDSGLGGVWNCDNEHSVMYDSAHTISSKTMTQFSEFPMPGQFSEYISHRKMLQYLQSYAEQFDLLKYIHFSCSIKNIVKTARGNYQVTLDSSPGIEEIYEFEHVAIATGHASKANVPDISLDNFEGDVFHSAQYKEPSIFKDKNVLVIGAGNSGCDIACEAIITAKNVTLSIRRGYYFIPKFVLGMPADVFGETSVKLRLPMRLRQFVNQVILRLFQGNIQKIGFPKPDHRIFESHPIVNELLVYYVRHGDIDIADDVKDVLARSVIMKNGKKVNVDTILFATGYKPDFDFLEESLRPNASRLHLNLFSKKHFGLSFLGLLDPNGGILGVIERQAIAVASAIALNLNKNEYASVVIKQVALNGGIDYIKSSRHEYEVDLATYQREIGRQIMQFRR